MIPRFYKTKIAIAVVVSAVATLFVIISEQLSHEPLNPLGTGNTADFIMVAVVASIVSLIVMLIPDMFRPDVWRKDALGALISTAISVGFLCVAFALN